MSKNEKIHIKLEICKDNSGKLTIMAHFNNNAPNIIINNNEYTWMPTIEEKELLNDAFNYFPLNKKTNQEEVKPKSPEPEIQKPIMEFKNEQEIKTHEKFKPIEEVKPSTEQKPLEHRPIEEKPIKYEKPDETIQQINKQQITKEEHTKTIEEEPVEEKKGKPNVFEIAVDDKPPLDEVEEPKSRGEMEVKVQIKKEEINEEELDTDIKSKKEKEEEEKILKEADNDAIEKALKKHIDNGDDDTIKEVDEQTIIDRVLSQKKKGKWGKLK